MATIPDIDDELILRFFNGRTDPAEEQRLLAWKNKNTANRKHFEAVRDIWMLSPVELPDGSVAQQLARLKQRIDCERSQECDMAQRRSG